MLIYDIARQIRAEGNLQRSADFGQTVVGRLLDDCITLTELDLPKLEQSKNGYVELEINGPLSLEHVTERVDSVDVKYVHKDGVTTKVGMITRNVADPELGIVSIFRSGESQGIRINQVDDRWYTIVGCVWDAVAERRARTLTTTNSNL